MSQKTKKKWLDIGSGVDQINAQAFLSTFSPSNYTPIQIGSEGTDKISSHLKGIDNEILSITSGGNITIQDDGSPQGVFTVLNFIGALLTANGSTLDIRIIGQGVSFKEQLFIGDGSIIDFSSIARIGAGTSIDTYFNGIFMREGKDWSRTISTQTLQALDGSLLPRIFDNLAKFRSRRWESGVRNIDEFFQGNGILTEFTNAEAFTDDSNIEVWFNGKLKREDVDWERDSATEKIKIIDGSPGLPRILEDKTELRVRVTNVEFAKQYFTGGVASITTSCLFNGGDKIDVFFNGELKEEGNDWTRIVGPNTINLVGGTGATTSNTEILVKIY